MFQRVADKLIRLSRATTAHKVSFEIVTGDRRIDDRVYFLVGDPAFGTKNGFVRGTGGG
ncbi:MAG: hypothetical protein ACE5K1_11130 [Acidiferrobacterales bacterium]